MDYGTIIQDQFKTNVHKGPSRMTEQIGEEIKNKIYRSIHTSINSLFGSEPIPIEVSVLGWMADYYLN